MKIAIVGAGFAGLAAAWDLAGAGHEVTVLDPQDRVGGLAAGFRDEGWDWRLEHFYHHMFLSDDAMLGLAEEIGVRDTIRSLRPVSASWWQGRAWPLDGPIEILRFPAMPFLDRVRMGAAGAWLKITRNWRALERVTAHDWLRRWMGVPAYVAVWEPLLIGKFGEDLYREVPMSWLWARLHARTFRLGYPDGGFQALADAFADGVRQRGGTIRLGVAVEDVRVITDGAAPAAASDGDSAESSLDRTRLRVRTIDHTKTRAGTGSESSDRATADDEPTAEDGNHTDSGLEGTDYDSVLVTTGPSLLARLAPGLPNEYLETLRELDSMGAVVLVLALRRSLMPEGTYWLNMDKRDFPFLAVVEHTNLIDGAHYGDDHLIYVGDYLPPDHPFITGDEQSILDQWLPALSRIQPDFDPSWVRAHWVFRTPYAQPVVPLGFSQHVPSLDTPIPGLYWASMSQVYPWDRGTNFAVEIGRRAARMMMDSRSETQ